MRATRTPRIGQNGLRKRRRRSHVKDVSPAVGTLRAIKSPGELALMQKAIDPSIDAHLEAMKMVRPGLYEYQVAAKMVEIHAYADCETEAYSPIVGTGFNSTVLHYNKLDRKIEDGDIVLHGRGRAVFRLCLRHYAHDSRQRKIYRRGSARSTKLSWGRRTPRSRRSSQA